MPKSVGLEENPPDRSPATAALNHSVLLSSVDGDKDLLRTITGLFLSSYPALLSEIRDAIARGDGKALARAAHTLKGSGGNFLTSSARQTLTDLELLAQEGNLNSAEERLVELEREMESIKPELSMLAEEDA